MVFIGGARQVGKTTLSLAIAPKGHCYLNWDILEDKEFILKQRFPKERFTIFDEIHKFKGWRNYLKGFYDRHKSKKKYWLQGAPGWIITDIRETLRKIPLLQTSPIYCSRAGYSNSKRYEKPFDFRRLSRAFFIWL